MPKSSVIATIGEKKTARLPKSSVIARKLALIAKFRANSLL
jgi:hypothetical protein